MKIVPSNPLRVQTSFEGKLGGPASAVERGKLPDVGIALFAYNRPHYLKKTLDGLSRNRLSSQIPLFAFVDGPKSKEDSIAVDAVIKLLRSDRRFNMKISSRSSNVGLSNSIVNGVTEVLREHDAVVVIEDDLELSPFFLDFMLKGLQTYRSSPQVMTIQGHSPPVPFGSSGMYFSRVADCWGWATWRRAWHDPRNLALKLLDTLRSGDDVRAFDMFGTFPNRKMLLQVAEQRTDSWALPWAASIFVQSGLSLYPRKSLVRNFGVAEKTNLQERWIGIIPLEKSEPKGMPRSTRESMLAYLQLSIFYARHRKSTSRWSTLKTVLVAASRILKYSVCRKRK